MFTISSPLEACTIIYPNLSANTSIHRFFHVFNFLISVLVRRIIHALNIRLPYTVVLLVLGVLFGLLSRSNESVHVYARVVDTDPHLILHIFLPVLIFESAFNMEVHTFLKTFIQVILLAIPGLGR